MPGFAKQHDGPGDVGRPPVVQAVEERPDHRDGEAQGQARRRGVGDLPKAPPSPPAVQPGDEAPAEQRPIEREPGIHPDHQGPERREREVPRVDQHVADSRADDTPDDRIQREVDHLTGVPAQAPCPRAGQPDGDDECQEQEDAK